MAQNLHEFLFRLKALFKKRRLDRDMAEELAFHQTMLQNKLLRQGVPAAEAEAQTRLEVLYGPVYQHAPGLTKVSAGPQLKRFLAVVSNLFRSFSDASKRAAAGVELVTLTPPLACFQADTGRHAAERPKEQAADPGLE